MRYTTTQQKGFIKFIAFGCLGVIAFAVILAFLGYRYLMGMVDEYTETEPRPIPAIAFTDAESNALWQRVSAFQSTLNASADPVVKRPLILSGRDLNILLYRLIPEYAQNVYVEIDGDTLKGQISLPLGTFTKLLEGHYLNGWTTFTAYIQNGRLDVRIADIEVKGAAIPADIKQQIATKNLAAEFNNNPEFAGLLGNIQTMQIELGQVVLIPK